MFPCCRIPPATFKAPVAAPNILLYKASAELVIDVTPEIVAILFKVVAPVTVNDPPKPVAPETVKLLEILVAPETFNAANDDNPPTVNAPPNDVVFVPVTERFPFSVVAPVTVNVPPKAVGLVPETVKASEIIVAPATVRVECRVAAPKIVVDPLR